MQPEYEKQTTTTTVTQESRQERTRKKSYSYDHDEATTGSKMGRFMIGTALIGASIYFASSIGEEATVLLNAMLAGAFSLGMGFFASLLTGSIQFKYKKTIIATGALAAVLIFLFWLKPFDVGGDKGAFYMLSHSISHTA